MCPLSKVRAHSGFSSCFDLFRIQRFPFFLMIIQFSPDVFTEPSINFCSPVPLKKVYKFRTAGMHPKGSKEEVPSAGGYPHIPAKNDSRKGRAVFRTARPSMPVFSCFYDKKKCYPCAPPDSTNNISVYYGKQKHFPIIIYYVISLNSFTP